MASDDKILVAEENVYQEHNPYKENSKFKPKHIGRERFFCDDKGFSYYIGTMWLDKITDTITVIEEKVPVIVNTKINNIDFMKMFLSCLKHNESRNGFDSIYKIYFDDKNYISYKGVKNLPDLEPLLIAHFLYCLEPLIRKGLKHNFICIEENINKIKGKLLFSKHVKYNEMRGLNMRAYCRFTEYNINCVENRILKKALIICQKHFNKNYTEINPKLAHCLAVFQNVLSEVSSYELNHFRVNPLYKEYKPALEVAKQIIKYKRYSDGTEKLSPPFWIDMSLLFEKYVYSLMLDDFSHWGKISYQKRYNAGIPDFLLVSHKVIADTKYKPNYNNTDINIDDVRQLSAYSRYKGIREHLGYDADDSVVPCLIIYPNKENSMSNFNGDKSNFEMSKGYKNFYKLGVKLPTIPPVNI